MSVLGDAVTARDTANRLVNLTNANTAPGATSVNATVLAAAVADTVAEFAIKAGETFDEANAVHLRLAIPGVWAFLASYKGQEGGNPQMDAFVRSCADYRATRSNKRITPITDRTLGPSADANADGTPRRPEFDRPRFGLLDVEPPPGNG